MVCPRTASATDRTERILVGSPGTQHNASSRASCRKNREATSNPGRRRGRLWTAEEPDFPRFELPAIEDDLALRFEELGEVIAGRPDYRQIITAGRLVPDIAIVGRLTADGAVLLIGVELDLGSEW